MKTELKEKEIAEDIINHPSHYTKHPTGLECIQLKRLLPASLGDALKYLWRAGLKKENTSLQDLQKAKWYLEDFCQSPIQINPLNKRDIEYFLFIFLNHPSTQKNPSKMNLLEVFIWMLMDTGRLNRDMVEVMNSFQESLVTEIEKLKASSEPTKEEQRERRFQIALVDLSRKIAETHPLIASYIYNHVNDNKFTHEFIVESASSSHDIVMHVHECDTAQSCYHQAWVECKEKGLLLESEENKQKAWVEYKNKLNQKYPLSGEQAVEIAVMKHKEIERNVRKRKERILRMKFVEGVWYRTILEDGKVVKTFEDEMNDFDLHTARWRVVDLETDEQLTKNKTMKKITKEELEQILAQHKLWLQDKTTGVRADLSKADLRFADLSQENLSQANLSEADLRFADLSEADLSGADLSGADLSEADLSEADLNHVDLFKANLSRTRF